MNESDVQGWTSRNKNLWHEIRCCLWVTVETMKKMAIETYISIALLNVNGLNAPTKRHRLDKQNELDPCNEILEKEMATHSSVLAWRIPGMVEPGGLPSMGSHRVGHD